MRAITTNLNKELLKKLLCRTSLYLCALSTAGCYNSTYLKNYTAEDAGPAPINYETSIRNKLEEILKDPDSMKNFSVQTPELASCSGIYLMQNFTGWRVTTAYNAKNSYGGYVGTRDQYFWFHNETLKGISSHPSYCPADSFWQ